MSFCTVINCMDGRTQLPVNEFLRAKYHVDYVDTITEAGPVRILAEDKYSLLAESIRSRVDISTNKHKSQVIALVAHHDCAGNPVDKSRQLEQLQSAIEWLKEKYPAAKILGLWVNSEWKVEIHDCLIPGEPASS
jgi:hypothetical protein